MNISTLYHPTSGEELYECYRKLQEENRKLKEENKLLTERLIYAETERFIDTFSYVNPY